MKNAVQREKMNIVMVGHVDHGKSTIVGRLLTDTHSLPKGKLEQVKKTCEGNSKPFEYAFLIDALKDEQAQGITIDSARVFFKTRTRDYIIIDAPGHIEFLKNMVTGASRAEAALLVIDAQEGVQENSRRHGYMLSMLGIKQVAILINKMDLVAWNEEVFNRVREEYSKFLSHLNMKVARYIPLSGREGDNVALPSSQMGWYQGETVLQILDGFEKDRPPLDKPFRMPVQAIYKFTNFDDQRRIVAGMVETGRLRPGDEVVFFPSGKKSRVKTIEAFNKSSPREALAGYAAGFTLQEQIYISRGEMATKLGESKPRVTSRLKTSLFWLGRDPMVKGKEYLLKLGTARVPVKLEEVHRVMDASDLHLFNGKDRLDRHDVGECTFKLKRAIAFDLAEEIAVTGRFVIVDQYEISGGGTILESLEDEQTWLREKVLLRNLKWEESIISPEQRAEKYNQKSTLILITGLKDSGKKPIAKRLEVQLFAEGKIVYFLGIGNVLYGVDADIKGKNNDRHEHLRRLAEVAHVLLDAGLILIATAIELTQDDLELIKTTILPDKLETIWIGKEGTTDILYDLRIPEERSLDKATKLIKAHLQKKGIIP